MHSKDPEKIRMAITVYTEVIELLRSVSPLNLNAAGTLGTCFLNRGQALYQVSGRESSEKVIKDFERTRQVLAPYINEGNPWLRRNWIGSLVNQSNVLLDLQKPIESRKLLIDNIDYSKWSQKPEALDVELKLMFHRAMCDSIAQLLSNRPIVEAEELAYEASEWVDEALEIIRNIRLQNNAEPFPQLGIRFFHMGAQIYAIYQSRYLEEFLEENLLSESSDINLRDVYKQIAKDSITLSIRVLGQKANARNCNLEEADQYRIRAENLEAFANESLA